MTCAAACRPDKKVLVCATPKMQETANKVVALNPDRLEYMYIEMTHFSSLVPSTRLDVERLRGRDVVLIADIRFDYILQFMSLLCEIPRYGARTFHVFVSFFLCGTMERVSDGELGSAKTFVRCLSMAPPALMSPTQFLLFDPHAPASRFFFSDSVGVDFISAVPLLKQYLKSKYAGKKPLVAFPDEGAMKRFKQLLPTSDADRVVFTKQRIGEQRILSCTEGAEFLEDGRPLVVVDDIVMSGGTLLTCADRCAELGCKDVSFFCVHAVFPDQAWKKFLPDARKAQGKPALTEFICTNTVPTTTQECAEAAPEFFRVLDIAPIVYSNLGF